MSLSLTSQLLKSLAPAAAIFAVNGFQTHRGMQCQSSLVLDRAERPLVWTVAQPKGFQKKRLDQFVRAFENDDVIQSFNKCEFEYLEIEKADWQAFVNEMIEGATSEKAKINLRKWKYAKNLKFAGVVLEPKVNGSEFTLTLHVAQEIDGVIYYKQANVVKSLEVLHKKAKLGWGWALLGRVSGFEAKWAEGEQQERDEYEETLTVLTRDDQVVNMFMAEIFAPALKASGVQVTYIE